jgi:uroporphyrinogen-III synthase
MRLLVTRPEPDGARTAENLRARGCEVLLAPLLRVEVLGDASLGTGAWTAVALTSANAALAVGKHRRRAERWRVPAAWSAGAPLRPPVPQASPMSPPLMAASMTS